VFADRRTIFVVVTLKDAPKRYELVAPTVQEKNKWVCRIVSALKNVLNVFVCFLFVIVCSLDTVINLMVTFYWTFLFLKLLEITNHWSILVLLLILCIDFITFSALTLLVGRQEEHPPWKKLWWGAGMVICLEWGANDLHMVQLMPLQPHCLLFQ